MNGISKSILAPHMEALKDRTNNMSPDQIEDRKAYLLFEIATMEDEIASMEEELSQLEGMDTTPIGH